MEKAQVEAIGLQRTAVVLAVSVSTLRRWIKEGKLEAFRAGPKLLRVPVSELRRIRKLGYNAKLDGPT